MLILKQGPTVIAEVAPGDGFQLPNGKWVSPAYAGWSNDDGYSLVQGVEIEPLGPVAADVDAERDRRLRSTFHFNGKEFNSDPIALQRIVGSASMAGFFMAAGGNPTDVNWHGQATPFVWIAADNTTVIMDAQTMFAFGQAAAANESAHIFAARALKDMAPIPSDFRSDSYWP